MKLLLKRLFSHKVILWVFIAEYAGMLAAVMLFHEDIGSEEGNYLWCKISMNIVTSFFVLFEGILTNAEFNGSKLMLTLPNAKTLHTRDMPLFFSLFSFVLSAAASAAYSVFILASGRDIANISDFLLIAAAGVFVQSVVGTVMVSLRAVGQFLGIILLLCTSNGLLFFDNLISYQMDNGFGLPVWQSLLIFVGAFPAGIVIAIVLAHLGWSKRAAPNNAPPVTNHA